jgi:opacity protein-like surface antigen
MRKLALLLAVSLTAALGAAASAQAYTCNGISGCTAWPGTGCIVTATPPWEQLPDVNVNGAVLCSARNTMSLDTWVQVYNAGNGVWYSIGEPGVGSKTGTEETFAWWYAGGVAGHDYRVMSQGCLGAGNCSVETAYSVGQVMP